MRASRLALTTTGKLRRASMVRLAPRSEARRSRGWTLRGPIPGEVTMQRAPVRASWCTDSYASDPLFGAAARSKLVTSPPPGQTAAWQWPHKQQGYSELMWYQLGMWGASGRRISPPPGLWKSKAWSVLMRADGWCGAVQAWSQRAQALPPNTWTGGRRLKRGLGTALQASTSPSTRRKRELLSQATRSSHWACLEVLSMCDGVAGMKGLGRTEPSPPRPRQQEELQQAATGRRLRTRHHGSRGPHRHCKPTMP